MFVNKIMIFYISYLFWIFYFLIMVLDVLLFFFSLLFILYKVLFIFMIVYYCIIWEKYKLYILLYYSEMKDNDNER